MKRLGSTPWLAIAIAVIFYIGTYFLCVFPVRLEITRGFTAGYPLYPRVPHWLCPTAIYYPIHFLDRECLRRSTWEERPPQDGRDYGLVEVLEVPWVPSDPSTNPP
jgi:hypothetical protein